MNKIDVVGNKNTLAKETIMQVTLSLLEKKSFEKLTVSEIVKASKYSRGSFYKYFEDKYDLLRKIMEQEAIVFTDILCVGLQRGQQTAVSIDYNYNCIVSIFNNALKKKTLYKLIFNSEIEECNMEKFCKVAVQNFLKKAEIVRKEGYQQDLGSIFYYCNTWLYMSYVKYWVERDFSIPVEEMARQVTYFVRGQKDEVVLQKKK